MPITVGSVGDIIALVQLAARVKKCLGASRGSSANFQGVVELMDNLQETLLATQRMLESIDAFPGASESFDILEHRRLVLAQIHRCRACISDYMTQIQKYGRSLSKQGSKNALSDIFRKLQWGTNEKSTMERFHQDIQLRLELLHLPSANLSRTVERHRHDRVQTYFQEASEERRHMASTTESYLIEIGMRLDCVMPVLTNNSRIDDWISSPYFANSTRFPTLPMDQFWIWKPVVVRYPGERERHLPMGIISGWDAMEYAFTAIFANAYYKITDPCRQESHLYNARLRRHFDSSQDFDSCFQAGDRPDMIVVLVIIAVWSSPKSSQRPRQRFQLWQSRRDRFPPQIHPSLVPNIAEYQISKTVRTLLSTGVSLGLAVLQVFPSLRSDQPDRCSEHRSMPLMDTVAWFRVHQSGRTEMSIQVGCIDENAFFRRDRPNYNEAIIRLYNAAIQAKQIQPDKQSPGDRQRNARIITEPTLAYYL